MSDIAISIRQPWAWLILHACKDVENRTWPTKVRGRVLIHASKGMTRAEYFDACDFYHSIEPFDPVVIPNFGELSRGGIVGAMNITDCVTESKSSWFFGPYGFVISSAMTLPFAPCKGSLGFFKVPS